MTDELKQEMTETFDKITPSEFTNPTMYDSLLKVYLAGAEHGYQYAVEHSDDIIRLIIRMAKKDIAFTEEEAVKFYHKAMEE